MVMCGFAGVRPGERVLRYKDTDEGSIIYEQQLARQRQLEALEQKQEQARRGETSVLLPAQFKHTPTTLKTHSYVWC